MSYADISIMGKKVGVETEMTWPNNNSCCSFITSLHLKTGLFSPVMPVFNNPFFSHSISFFKSSHIHKVVLHDSTDSVSYCIFSFYFIFYINIGLFLCLHLEQNVPPCLSLLYPVLQNAIYPSFFGMTHFILFCHLFPIFLIFFQVIPG